MRAIAAAGLSHVLAVYMILVWPVLVRRRYQTLKRGLQEHDPNARMRAYRRMLLHQGAMVTPRTQKVTWGRRGSRRATGVRSGRPGVAGLRYGNGMAQRDRIS